MARIERAECAIQFHADLKDYRVRGGPPTPILDERQFSGTLGMQWDKAYAAAFRPPAAPRE